METVIITKNKESILATDALIGEDLQAGLDIRLNIYKIAGTGETDELLNQSMTESVKKPGIYLFPWTPSSSGNYRVDIFEQGNTNELAPTFASIKVTETDLDSFTGAAGLSTDFGVIQTFEQGDTVTLEMLLFSNLVLTNADSLPTISVIDEIGVTVASGTAVLISTGRYSFTYKLSKGARIGNWRFLWSFTVNSVLMPSQDRTQFFKVITLTCVIGSDNRVGFAFDNPDLVSNDGCGAIITPDELRYVYAFGNDAVAPNGATITDSVMKWYVDNAVGEIERDLNVTLCKKRFFFRDFQGQPARDLVALGKVSPTDEEGIDFFREDPYDFIGKEFREYIWIKFRTRPIIELTEAKFIDLTGQDILNLLDFGPKVNHDKGSAQFFPNQGSLASLALITSNSTIFNNVLEARGNYPDAYVFDYEAGFKTVRHLRAKWPELFKIVGNLAAINLLNDLGDGKSPGLASSSIGLSGISESFATTQSATNALYGAHILNLEKQLKKWYDENRNKYSGLLFTAL